MGVENANASANFQKNTAQQGAGGQQTSAQLVYDFSVSAERLPTVYQLLG